MGPLGHALIAMKWVYVSQATEIVSFGDKYVWHADGGCPNTGMVSNAAVCQVSQVHSAQRLIMLMAIMYLMREKPDKLPKKGLRGKGHHTSSVNNCAEAAQTYDTDVIDHPGKVFLMVPA